MFSDISLATPLRGLNNMRGASDPPSPRMLLAIGLLSAAALAYEVLLVRLFSIIQWHQFAFMIISVALLGYGAGGSFLSLWAARLETRFGAAFVIQAALFGASTIPCFLAAQALRFNPLEALWDPGQGFRLCGIYLLLCLPFAFAACCIGLALGHYRERLHYVYACDLVGASGGAIGVMGLLYLVFPGTALKAVALLGLFAALIACRGLGSRWVAPALVLAIAGPLVLPEGWVRPRPLPYKGLPQTLEILGTRVIAERSSPLGILQVIREPPGAVPPRPRFEPELTLRAARAARALPGCRRHERDHPLPGGRRDTRLPGLSCRRPCPIT